MGLTDAPQQVSLTDVYPPGTAFTVVKAWIEGQVETQFGKRTMGKVLVTPAGGGEETEFAVWGSLAQQVQQVEEGDLPMTCQVAKDGQRWLFAEPPAGTVAPGGEPTQPPPADQRADAGDHVDPGAPSDPPNPAPAPGQPGPEPEAENFGGL